MKRIKLSYDFVFVVLAFIGFAFFVVSRGQDVNFDLLNYHYFTGYAYLHGRTGDIAPALIQSFMHPGFNVISYLAYTYLSFPLNALFLYCLQFISIFALILISRQLAVYLKIELNNYSRYVALLLCLLSPQWISELGTSFFSSSSAVLILFALYLILKHNNKPGKNWFFSGILLGLAFGLKLTNALFIVASIISLLIIIIHGRQWTFIKAFGFFALGGMIGFGLTASWYYHIWREWSNPFFPVYNDIFKSPYFSTDNWKSTEWPWRFKDIQAFFSFFYQSAVGTKVTSETFFTDTRYLISGVLLVCLVVTRKFKNINSYILAFIAFVVVSTTLWAVMFAYQRYLIPTELLLGLFIWVAICLLFASRGDFYKIIILACAGYSISTIKVPEWGHIQLPENHTGPFGVTIPEAFSTPAQYVHPGKVMSFLLPYLHPDSIFYGLSVSSEVDKLIKEKIAKHPDLPLRVVFNTYMNKDVDWIRKINPFSDKTWLQCENFGTYIGVFTMCEFQKKPLSNADDNQIASHIVDKDIQKGFLNVQGLGGLESLGRWSDNNKVIWRFTNCLPEGKVKVKLNAAAFQSMLGKSFIATVGGESIPFELTNELSEKEIIFDITQTCADTLMIDIPVVNSPFNLGIANDQRPLGIFIKDVNVSTVTQ
ncbi:DUF2029 domain-containing protein [Atlantibacter subterranea]|uniref:glycosyltransferase family 87 protein n=1 Tax=Atlantibacter subterraneus TaxID=255519 RepID=UPI0011829803|nr:glycosyltransferase family 87 protein [Atlantibacter subterranea]TSJ59115.1 DUF2029 domain-containing protein [Atlantibacter subterranea]